jgi:hypothetical protein
MRDIPALNLDYLRWKYGTHEALSKKLEGVLNWNDLSKYSLGDKPIPKSRARAIESRLSLPNGWLDRENISLTTLTEDDYLLVTKLLLTSPKIKQSIGSLLSAITEKT